MKTGRQFPSLLFEIKSLFLIIFFILIGVLVGIHQGRGYFLTAAGLFATLFVVQIFRRYFQQQNIRYEILTGAVFIVALSIFILIGYKHFQALNKISTALPAVIDRLMNLNFMQAYEILDLPRASLFKVGCKIFQENPLIGTGLNSFMTETAFLRATNSTIPADNPATFFIGVLSDTGIIGFIFLSSVCVYFINYNFNLLRGNKNILLQRVHLLPLMMFLPCFIGYHVIFAEFAAFLILPFIIMKPRDTESNNFVSKKPLSNRLRIIFLYIVLYTPVACIIGYACIYVIQLNITLPQSYWRHEKGILPQLKPDMIVQTRKYGRVFYFQKKRDLALSMTVPKKVTILIYSGGKGWQLNGRCNGVSFEAKASNTFRKVMDVQAIRLNTSGCAGKYPHIYIELMTKDGKPSFFGIQAIKFKKHRLIE